MYRIDENDYGRFIPLADANNCNRVYPLSIAEGIQCGDIFTEQRDDYSCAFFWHLCGFGYISGAPSETFLCEIADLIRNRGHNNPRRLVIQSNDAALDEFFSLAQGITSHKTYNFAIERGSMPKSPLPLPDGFELLEADEILLSRVTGRIIPSFSWSGTDEFLKHGKGYCAVIDGFPAAIAFSAAISHDEMDIGLETAEEYRSKGLAAAVAQKMAEYAYSQGKTPVWECHNQNIGSRRTAEKIGFRVTNTFNCFKEDKV